MNRLPPVRPARCWSVAAPMEGEEPLLLKAFENLLVQYPRAMMILAPRRPERFAAVAALLEQMSIRFFRKRSEVEWRNTKRGEFFCWIRLES